jgi:hypothetical protein
MGVHINEYVKKGAVISECGRYRFQLWRIWDETKPLVLWIMHNPSTADENYDDPTIRRVISFSKSWGYGGVYVGNLFPYRSTNPDQLLKKDFSEICPAENISHTYRMKSLCQEYILAYGNPIIKDFSPNFFDDDWKALKVTKDGNPCHPLYLKSTLIPKSINELINENN